LPSSIPISFDSSLCPFSGGLLYCSSNLFPNKAQYRDAEWAISAAGFIALIKSKSWMSKAEASGIPELQRFANGLQRDKAAILAGLTLIHSNGQVEGQVTRIKLIKRMMFGRAGFALLRQRVLHAL